MAGGVKVVVEVENEVSVLREIDVETCVTGTLTEVVTVSCGSVTAGGVKVVVTCGRVTAGGVKVVVISGSVTAGGVKVVVRVVGT